MRKPNTQVELRPLSRQAAHTKRTTGDKERNFGVTANLLQNEHIIANVKYAFRQLDVQTAEEVYKETSGIQKLPKEKLTGKEKTSLRNFNKDNDSIILTADKGNSTVY